jgi:hypothetical protein
VHVAESPEASSAAESLPTSHTAHAPPSGRHVQAPFRHWSAAYLLPQQPSHVTGGVPVHVAESPEASAELSGALVEPQATSQRARMSVEKGRLLIYEC